MNHREYEQINALNWSTLKTITVSPAKMKHIMDHPEERGDTDAFRRGRAIHCATLEPDRFFNGFVVVPDFDQIARDKFGSLRTKEARLFRDASRADFVDDLNPGAEQITEEDREIALRCADGVRAHKRAMELLSGAKVEQVVEWIHPGTGVHCKGRLDILTNRVIDLKSTRRETVREILRDAAMFDYHCQVAWYHEGAKVAGLIDGRTPPAAIFVHATPGSKFVDVAVLDMGMDPSTLESALKTCDKMINLYAGCLAADMWPGMCSGIEAWTIPDWKME
jgi:hypothetical protein